jgi:hypothetical protein
MGALLTSRERMMRAIKRDEVDHVPCAFMSFSAMRGRCQDAYEVCERELEMGLDSMMFVPSSWRGARPNHTDLRGLPVRLPPTVRTDLWIEDAPAEGAPILHKEYHTPAGTLTARVRKTGDWPHGNFVPLMEDYQIPRALKPLVTGPDDLPPLRAILQPPHPDDIAEFRREMTRARAFRDQKGALLAGGWGVGADMVGWLCGLQHMPLLALDQPEFLAELLALIGEWNRARMKVILEAGVDLYIRRGWYESTDFWSPSLYAHFIAPLVRAEAALAHEYGTPFAQIMTTGSAPMLGHLLDAGVDALIGVDPLDQRGRALTLARERVGGKMALWGGINGAITVEEGSEQEVRQAVRDALQTMRGVPGFILSPVDNLTEITRRAWRNIDVLIEEWGACANHAEWNSASENDR